ncbi:carboxylic ester hydrolase [Favolaschia claudopus]|uniref:Carboxylic ester hydrolase n=1 Tax=Favolaschia claudopus TaxID=2862362 RepID=A0AAW0D4M1_9AGAR
MPLPLLAAELAANFVSCILYGIYLVTLGMAVQVLLTKKSASGRRMRRRGWAELNWVMLGVEGVLLVNSTLDLSVAFATLVEAFVNYRGPGGPIHVFEDRSGWGTFVKTVCVGVQTLVGDGILIYRCWFIWSKSWPIIVFPMVLWLGTLASAIGLLVSTQQFRVGLVNSADGLVWGLGLFALTISTNIFTTSLIVWRIWSVQRQTKKYRITPAEEADEPESMLTRGTRNIVESGMIYTVCSILELIAFATQSPLNYPASALAFHSVGIAFNLIVIRGSVNQSDFYYPNETDIRFAQSLSTSNDMPSTSSGVESKQDVFILSSLHREPTSAPKLETSKAGEISQNSEFPVKSSST